MKNESIKNNGLGGVAGIYIKFSEILENMIIILLSDNSVREIKPSNNDEYILEVEEWKLTVYYILLNIIKYYYIYIGW